MERGPGEPRVHGLKVNFSQTSEPKKSAVCILVNWLSGSGTNAVS